VVFGLKLLQNPKTQTIAPELFVKRSKKLPNIGFFVVVIEVNLTISLKESREKTINKKLQTNQRNVNASKIRRPGDIP
jgi:hypothetical protein